MGAVIALVLFVALVEYLYHNYSITQMAIQDLQTSIEGKDTLGVPIRTGWFITGGLRLRGNDGAANLYTSEG